jgi:TrmH family RNA methyltransferase
MLSINQQKFVASLQVKKYRQKYLKFVVEGEKMAAELLAQQRIPVSAVFGTERWLDANRERIPQFSDKFNLVTENELKKISSLTTPNQVLIVADMPDDAAAPDLLRTDWCFYLDGIQDPGNMGTILRIADWFGIPAVFCAPDTVDVYSPKVIQAGMGAFLRIRSVEIPLDELVAGHPGVPVLGAVLGGENVFNAQLPDRGLLVIGREGQGVRPDTEALLTHRLTIPRHPGGGAESLNAAVATGILTAFLRRSLSIQA